MQTIVRTTTALSQFFLLTGFLSAGEPTVESRHPIAAARPGERCVICGTPLSGSDIAVIVKGRRVPVMKEMASAVLKDPETYFKNMQARGALFQEEFQIHSGATQAGVSLGWFLAGLYVVIALIFGGLSGVTAVAKGLPAISSFFVGFGLSLFGYLYVLTRPSQIDSNGVAPLEKVPITQLPLACPQCGNTNHPAAASCAACHVLLLPQGRSDLRRSG